MRKTLISVLIGFTSLVLVGLLGLTLLSTNSAPTPADNSSDLSQGASQPLTSTIKSASPVSATVYHGQPTQCIASSDKQPPECFAMKQTAFAQMDATFAAKETASVLTPRPTSRPLPKVQQPKITPSKEDSQIYAITPTNIGVGGDSFSRLLRHCTSVWQVPVSNADMTAWYALMIFTVPPSNNPVSLQMGILHAFRGESTPDDIKDKYNKKWILPRDIGAVTITNVTGPEGIVSFKGANGEAGTFDLKTEQWHFDNSSVAIAAATPAPTIFTTIPEPTLTPTFTPNAR
jgi:hypothetical protein